jgi:hypothetical protein
MKARMLCLLLLCAALAPLAPAADAPSGSKNWYTFVIFTGGSTDTFTGSSTLSVDQMATAVASGTQAISLTNLRSFGVQPGSTDPTQRWYASPSQDPLFLLPRTVVYFYALSSDPLNGSSSPVVLVK